MSQHTPVNHEEHGTLASYIIGFLLSLMCTLIPYYLVTRQAAAQTSSLLKVILAFAFVQVVIQVVFFLHLGRGPKPRWNLYFFIATLVIVGVVVGGSVMIMNNLHYNMKPQDATKKVIDDEGIAQLNGVKTGACDVTHKNHIIYIVDGKVTPIHTESQRCDTLTFVNKDDMRREMAFGVHPAHTPYAGVREFPLTKKKNYTITLSQSGTFEFHDHDHPDTFGTFTVSGNN